MEMKYVVPEMAQSFGTLEFAGESEPVFERDKNNRRVLARRSYNLYSDVQKGENVVVEIPVQAGAVSLADVRADIEATIDEAMNITDPEVQANFKKYFGNKRPTPEEYIYTITKKTKVKL